MSKTEFEPLGITKGVKRGVSGLRIQESTSNPLISGRPISRTISRYGDSMLSRVAIAERPSDASVMLTSDAELQSRRKRAESAGLSSTRRILVARFVSTGNSQNVL